jgi:hypothetical protein
MFQEKIYNLLNLFQPYTARFLLAVLPHTIAKSDILLALAAAPFEDALPRDIKTWAKFSQR